MDNIRVKISTKWRITKTTHAWKFTAKCTIVFFRNLSKFLYTLQVVFDGRLGCFVPREICDDLLFSRHWVSSFCNCVTLKLRYSPPIRIEKFFMDFIMHQAAVFKIHWLYWKNLPRQVNLVLCYGVLECNISPKGNFSKKLHQRDATTMHDKYDVQNLPKFRCHLTGKTV